MTTILEYHKDFGTSLELRRADYFSVDPKTSDITFTVTGRRYYSYWFNRNGLSLDAVANLEDFCERIKQVNCAALAEADSRIERLLATNPNLDSEDRAFLAGLIEKPELAAMPTTFPEVPANVVPLRTLKQKQA